MKRDFLTLMLENQMYLRHRGPFKKYLLYQDKNSHNQYKPAEPFLEFIARYLLCHAAADENSDATQYSKCE